MGKKQWENRGWLWGLPRHWVVGARRYAVPFADFAGARGASSLTGTFLMIVLDGSTPAATTDGLKIDAAVRGHGHIHPVLSKVANLAFVLSLFHVHVSIVTKSSSPTVLNDPVVLRETDSNHGVRILTLGARA